MLHKHTSLGDLFNPDKIGVYVNSFGYFAPIIFILIYIIATVMFLPGTPFSILAGFLFGISGLIYVLIAATIGASFAFFISHFLGHTFVKDFIGKRFISLAKYDEKLEKNGIITVLLLRFVPIFPFNGLNFGFGLTRIKFHDYLIGTFIGILPLSFIYVYIGNLIYFAGSSENIIQIIINDPVFYLFILVFIAMIIIPLKLKKRKKSVKNDL